MHSDQFTVNKRLNWMYLKYPWGSLGFPGVPWGSLGFLGVKRHTRAHHFCFLKAMHKTKPQCSRITYYER